VLAAEGSSAARPCESRHPLEPAGGGSPQLGNNKPRQGAFNCRPVAANTSELARAYMLFDMGHIAARIAKADFDGDLTLGYR